MAASKKKPVAKKVAKRATAAKKVAKQKPAAKAKKVDVEARVAALPPEKAVEPPGYPVVFASAEAAKLVRLGKAARAELAKMGSFEIRFVDELPAYREFLEDCEAEWNKARAKGSEGAGPRTIEQAENLKTDLMASGRYLLRHDPLVQQRLDQIAAGSGLLDLAEDLRELAKLVEEFPTVFAADASLPRAASARSRDLADKIVANVTGPSSDAVLAKRNLAFWLVAQANAEIRAALRFVFRKRPAKLAELGVAYSTRKEREAKPKAPANPAPVEA